MISILLTLIVCITGILLYTRTRRYQHHIQSLLTKYKILHQKFQIIYDNMPVALFICDEQGRLKDRNPTALKLEKTWYPHQQEDQKILQELRSNVRLTHRINKRENINQVVPILNGHYQPRPSGIYQEACEFFRLVVRYIPDEQHNRKMS